jgi:cell fate (sporulation/competence/biofilm development) regulator YlbF (YheA/YmcA/DUF963 family)
MVDTLLSPIQSLCSAVTERADFDRLKKGLDQFLSDEQLKFQFQQVNDMGRHLQARANQGDSISNSEIQEFESLRSELTSNVVVQEFLHAQDQLQQLQQTIGKFIEKTFELGRCPQLDEVDTGCCGGGCGCN